MKPKWQKLACPAQEICTLYFQFFGAVFASKGYTLKNIASQTESMATNVPNHALNKDRQNTCKSPRNAKIRVAIWWDATSVHSKAVVLLLLTFCLLLLPLWESVIVLCFVVRYFMSILVLQSSWWGRESWLLCLICLPGVSCWLSALLRGAMGLSAVCDCGISWSYSLTIFETIRGSLMKVKWQKLASLTQEICTL